MREGNRPMGKTSDPSTETRQEKPAHESLTTSEFLAEWFGPSACSDSSYKEIRCYRGRIDEWISLQTRKLQVT
jgi:hypothetical protein